MGSLGDTLIALPALHLVRRAFPEAELRLLTNVPVSAKAPPAAAILEHTGLVDGYERYAVGTRSVRELAGLVWRIRRWRPEALVYLGASRGVESAMRDARFFRVCGIERQIGVPVTEEMDRNRYDAATGEWEPEAARLARNIAELGDARLEDAASWSLGLTAAEERRAAEVLGEEALGRPVLAVSVGTKVQAKDWGRENWRALLRGLGEAHPEMVLALAGAPEESEASEFAAAGWREGVATSGRGGGVRGPGGSSTGVSGSGGSAGTVRGLGRDGAVVNLCGRLTPRESAAVFARARLFVGHDSGPMHLAAAVGTRCVAIFAARNKPRIWFPYGEHHRVLYHQTDCWGCGLETCIIERKKCITSISVGEVAAEVSAALDVREL